MTSERRAIYIIDETTPGDEEAYAAANIIEVDRLEIRPMGGLIARNIITPHYDGVQPATPNEVYAAISGEVEIKASTDADDPPETSPIWTSAGFTQTINAGTSVVMTPTDSPNASANLASCTIGCEDNLGGNKTVVYGVRFGSLTLRWSNTGRLMLAFEGHGALKAEAAMAAETSDTPYGTGPFAAMDATTPFTVHSDAPKIQEFSYTWPGQAVVRKHAGGIVVPPHLTIPRGGYPRFEALVEFEDESNLAVYSEWRAGTAGTLTAKWTLGSRSIELSVPACMYDTPQRQDGGGGPTLLRLSGAAYRSGSTASTTVTFT